MITDLFSHKIHSSSSDWQDRLVELAYLFSKFEGRLYDREELERTLSEISPRSAYAHRDPSKFRDEISAYPAYLGLYRLVATDAGWIICLSQASKKLLLIEEPDVASFLRVQLTVFQYPNGSGIAYGPSGSVRLQANARDRTLEFIRGGVHLSPMRFIIQALSADAKIKNTELIEASISSDEIYSLANDSRVNTAALPEITHVISVLNEIRRGEINPPASFERRFDLLRHTDLFELTAGGLKFRAPADEADKEDMVRKIDAISSVKSQFGGFDTATSSDEIIEVISKDEWGKYFDAFNTLDAEVVSTLCEDSISVEATTTAAPIERPIVVPMTQYGFRERDPQAEPPPSSTRIRELADPEVTRIKRQRRTIDHKVLVDTVDHILRDIDAVPQENPHIDLYAEIPSDGSFVFEMKSGGENLLDQIRKGISQLYEYHYRYKDSIKSEVTLCLVLRENPTGIEWVKDYVCKDRGICLCWLGEDGQLEYPDGIADKMRILVSS